MRPTTPGGTRVRISRTAVIRGPCQVVQSGWYFSTRVISLDHTAKRLLAMHNTLLLTRREITRMLTKGNHFIGRYDVRQPLAGRIPSLAFVWRRHMSSPNGISRLCRSDETHCRKVVCFPARQRFYLAYRTHHLCSSSPS